MLRSGTIVGGRYVVESALAVGGMGAVYRAQHLVSDRAVALKIVHPHLTLDRAAVARFHREARASASIGHEGIVTVLDAGEDDEGHLFLAMELLSGENLRARLARTDTTRGQALALIDALLDPLAAAHARGFVHRDLKPENVFVTTGERIKLLDFGIARELGAASATQTGAAMGTPHYMPPEQVMSSKGATPAADVWAVGVMLYEILTGAPPFTGPTPHAVVVRACTTTHAPLVEVAPDVGPRLAAVVDRALAKQPADRFADADALRASLREALGRDPDSSHAPVTLAPPAARSIDDSAPDAPTLPASSPPMITPSTGGARAAWERHLLGDGLSISLPPGWTRRESNVPYVVLLAIMDAFADVDPPTDIRLKIEPWEGDTRSFADLGITNIHRVATILRTADADLAGEPAVEVEALYGSFTPPVRVLSRCAVVAGHGWVVQLRASPERYADVAATFRAILGTLRRTHDDA